MDCLTVKPIDCSVKPFRSVLLITRKKNKNIRQCHSKIGTRKSGIWNLSQTIKYIAFIKENIGKLATEECRRQSKVFRLMAKKIRTRSSIQCRSHHQKMKITWGELPNIVSHYEENVIPYYSAKATASEVKNSTIVPPDNIYSFKLVGGVLRIQIKEEYIEEY